MFKPLTLNFPRRLLEYTTGTTFLVLCFVIRGVEGNGAAMDSVGALSLLVRTFPSQTSTVTVSHPLVLMVRVTVPLSTVIVSY